VAAQGRSRHGSGGPPRTVTTPISVQPAHDGSGLRVDAGSVRIDRVSVVTPQGRTLLEDRTPFTGSRTVAAPLPLRGLCLVHLQGEGIDRTIPMVGP